MNATHHIKPKGLGLRSKGGYILLEATVALILLSVGAYSVHGVIRQAIVTRGQAEDYTRARFLMNEKVADLEIQPTLFPGSKSGRFEGDDDRFRWTYTISSKPLLSVVGPSRATPPIPGPFKYERDTSFVVHLVVTLEWSRAGRDFSETYETLISPDKLYLPGEF